MEPTQSSTEPNDQNYQVVARKYRPQNFGSLIGQEHIATALSNAINQNRIGHAYLFTGARGVGKTSSARIFAKCLNCQQGPTPQPCNDCDICQAISIGEDVDVLEIDGASNRGIDEIRSLRSNAAIRPSRARFKIYIIDEVHMLTPQAFNALLKTLEEPPRHVKFIFCTTDPQKIPITVLSRCQRFDFSPVQTPQIASSLAVIAEKEGVAADEEALMLLARRANGSMRDSQSLLEQLFSFCENEITAAHVHQLLGTADLSKVAGIAQAMIGKDSTQTLTLIHQSALEGTDAGELASQLLAYFRDAMAVKVNCSLDTLLMCSASDLPDLNRLCEEIGLETLLAIIQILDTAIVKMQSSLHARTLLEVAAIRVCNLENLDLISDLIKQVSETPKKEVGVSRSESVPLPNPATLADKSEAKDVTPPSNTAKKKEVTASPRLDDPHSRSVPTPISGNLPANSSPEPKAGLPAVTEKSISGVWPKLVERIGGMTADLLAGFESVKLPLEGRLTVTLTDPYKAQQCNKPERKRKIEELLSELVQRNLVVDFVGSKKVPKRDNSVVPQLSRAQQMRMLQDHPFVKNAIETFDGELVSFLPAVKRNNQ